MQDFLDVFGRAQVDGALAASVFHSGEMDIGGLKQFLSANAVDIRP
jgi:cyclase